MPQAVNNTIKSTDSNQLRDFDSPNSQVKISRLAFLKSSWKKKLLYPATIIALFVLVGMGVMAKNGWLPATDALTGKKTGWFGAPLPQNAASSWNPLANPLPTPTPQLSKEYIYAGSRLLAVEDANANAAPPADLAVWRPSSGQWWVMGGAGSTQTTIQWGVNGDKTVPGDYDGDGKTDIAVWRSGNWTFYVLRSSDGSLQYSTLGQSSSIPVPADYDGDGKADMAVRSGNNWIIKRSSDNQVDNPAPSWGTSGDIEVPNDYDGDGKVDIAVWRPSNGNWYIRQSSKLGQANELRQVQWGMQDDFPVPAFYRR